MNIHGNARLTPCRREEMAIAVISGRLSQIQAGRVFGVSAKIVARWTDRYRTGGRAAMGDRSSRPRHIPRQTDETLALRVTELRRQRLTGAHIALETGISPATVSRILKRAGLSRIRDIEPAEPVVRYEYKEPGIQGTGNTRNRAASSILISNAWAGSTGWATASRNAQSRATAPGKATHAGWAGSMSISASTTPRASPSPTSIPTRRPPAPSPASRRRLPTIMVRHQGCPRDDG